MEIGEARLVLTKDGSDIPIKDLTPPEAVILHVIHGPVNGGKTFGEKNSKIKVVGTAMVATGETKTIIDSPEVEAVPAVFEDVVVTPAIPAVGEPGKTNYKPGVAAVTQKMLVKPAIEYKPEESHEEAILRPRTDVEELNRLYKLFTQALQKDGTPIIAKIYPDRLNPKLPQTFKEINWVQVSEATTGIMQAEVNYITGGLKKSL